MTATDSQGGYALLDAMIALGIVAVVSGMFVQVVQTTSATRRHDEQRRQAIVVAQSRLAELGDRSANAGTGRSGDLIWRTEVAPFRGTANGPGLQRVTVTVADAASRREVVQLETLRLVQ